jgi:D-amino-acid dehydrogenase
MVAAPVAWKMTGGGARLDPVTELLVVGGGIVGCSAAAFAAERGAKVTLVEATEIGAGASGRNSGSVQHPFDAVLAGLHSETLSHYRATSDAGDDFAFPESPAGLLLLTDDLADAEARSAELAIAHPELAPGALGPDALAEAEPILAPGLSALSLATGYPIPPDAATAGMARRARKAGATLRLGVAVTGLVEEGLRVAGVTLADGERIAAEAVLVAAGPWSPKLIDPSGAWPPIRPTYGVTVQLELGVPAHHILEEGVVHTVNRPVEGGPARDVPSTFSLISVGATSTLGSTFLPWRPEPAMVAPLLVERGTLLVPGVRDARLLASRVCARPQSIDGRPFIGAVPGRPGLFVCAGHGPWGISTGPASAAMVVEAILGAMPVPGELEAARGSAVPEPPSI